MSEVKVSIVMVFTDGQKCVIQGFSKQQAEQELQVIADHIGSVAQLNIASKAAVFMRDVRYAYLAYPDLTPIV